MTTCPPSLSHIRVLLIAEAANPEWTSVPLEGWSHSIALAEVADIDLVTQIRNRDAMLRAGLEKDKDFFVIDSERISRPMWWLASLLRGGEGKGWTTMQALAPLRYYYFEHLVWKKFGPSIKSGKYHIVHRLTPLSPTTPSLLAKKCAKRNVPFIVGPLNGGLPWPEQFQHVRKREKEWLVPLRETYRVFPGYRSMRTYAAAILAGSQATLEQLPEEYRHKIIYIPENGIDPNRFHCIKRHAPSIPLQAIFVGRLVPYKGADMLLEAVASLIQEGRLELRIVGDGPERESLQALATKLQIRDHVIFTGNVDHKDIARYLNQADVFTFPSIREFGGAVVLEAMVMGAVPVVVKYGGPAELISPDCAFAVELGSRAEIISRLRVVLEHIVSNPNVLIDRSKNARKRACDLFSWAAKARQVYGVYEWVLGLSNKPSYFEIDGTQLVEKF